MVWVSPPLHLGINSFIYDLFTHYFQLRNIVKTSKTSELWLYFPKGKYLKQKHIKCKSTVQSCLVGGAMLKVLVIRIFSNVGPYSVRESWPKFATKQKPQQCLFDETTSVYNLEFTECIFISVFNWLCKFCATTIQ